MDFNYLYRILLKRKWLIIGSAILAGFVAQYFLRDEAKSYKSVAQISTGFTMTDQLSMGLSENLDMMAADTKFNNVLVTMASPTVINLLSYSLILHDLEGSHPFRVLGEDKKKLPLYRSIDQAAAITQFRDNLENMTMLSSFNPEQKKLLEFLALYKYDYKSIEKYLSTYRVQRTDYIQIEFTSGNPELSAYVVNTLYQQFLRYYKTVRTEKSQESIDTLRSLMEKKKLELDAKNALLHGEQPSSIAVENTHKYDAIANLDQTLTTERSKLTRLNFELQRDNQKLSEAGVTSQTQLPTNQDNTAANNELLTLRTAMNDTYAQYVNGGSSDKSLLNKYNSLKAQYQAKLVSISPSSAGAASKDPDNPETKKRDLIEKRNDIQIDIQASTATIADLEQRLSQLKGTAIQDANKNVALESLQRDADLANKEYQAVKQRYNQALDISSSAPTNFRQVLMGQPAIEPEPSKKILAIAGAAVGIAVIEIIFILLQVFFDSTLRTPTIFAKTVNLKLISIINWMDLKRESLNTLVTSVDLAYDPKDKQRSHNTFRESLRKLRYEIEHSGKKIFLFTSTTKGQGKTTLIQALSYSMSLSKKKILIIDTNFCNNDLTINLEAAPILEKIVPSDRSQDSLIEQIRNLSKDIGVGNVFVIGSQGGDYTPSEILPSRNLLHHLHILTAEYDYIFLEGPPLNEFTDSKELAQYVDGIIAVFAANHVMNQLDKESMQFFRELNGKFTGAILNMVDLEMATVT